MQQKETTANSNDKHHTKADNKDRKQVAFTENTYFKQEQLRYQSNGRVVVDPVIMSRIQEAVLDNFTFKFASIVCSLEHNQLTHCFEQENARKVTANDNVNNDVCLKESKNYGDCVYKRFNNVVDVSCSQPKRCKTEYKLYENCLKLMTNDPINDYANSMNRLWKKISSYKWNEVQGNKHTIPYASPCEELFWHSLYKCLSRDMLITIRSKSV
jgi:hypothetical protein